MLYMIINQTRSGLKPEELEQLGQLATHFYENMPEGIVLQGDWAALDYSRTFALIEAESLELLEEIQAPFRDYVEMTVTPVAAVTGWGKS